MTLGWDEHREDVIDPDAVLKPGHYGYELCAACEWPLPPRDDRDVSGSRHCFDCWWQIQADAFTSGGPVHPMAISWLAWRAEHDKPLTPRPRPTGGGSLYLVKDER